MGKLHGREWNVSSREEIASSREEMRSSREEAGELSTFPEGYGELKTPPQETTKAHRGDGGFGLCVCLPPTLHGSQPLNSRAALIRCLHKYPTLGGFPLASLSPNKETLAVA